MEQFRVLSLYYRFRFSTHMLFYRYISSEKVSLSRRFILKILSLTLCLMLASCLDFGGATLTPLVIVVVPKPQIHLIQKFFRWNCRLQVDISKKMKESDHLNITTRRGRISGSVHSLRSKPIEIPRKLDSVLVSTVSGANRKLIKVSSNFIKVGY